MLACLIIPVLQRLITYSTPLPSIPCTGIADCNILVFVDSYWRVMWPEHFIHPLLQSVCGMYRLCGRHPWAVCEIAILDMEQAQCHKCCCQMIKFILPRMVLLQSSSLTQTSPSSWRERRIQTHYQSWMGSFGLHRAFGCREKRDADTPIYPNHGMHSHLPRVRPYQLRKIQHTISVMALTC